MKKQNLSLVAILLIPIGIAINYVGGQVAVVLKLPIFIDVIGTVLVGALAGPFLGGATGLATNLILGITNPGFLPYSIVSLAVGIVSGLAGKKGWFKSVKGLVFSGLAIWGITQLTAIPITVYLFGGVTGSGSSFITAFLAAAGQSLFASVFTTSLITETADKVITVIVVYLIVKAIPDRTMLQFPLGGVYVNASEGENERSWD